MNTGEQRELRQWADQLCEVDDPERRAVGRAIAIGDAGGGHER
jgi:hypothetical protein